MNQDSDTGNPLPKHLLISGNCFSALQIPPYASRSQHPYLRAIQPRQAYRENRQTTCLRLQFSSYFKSLK